MASKKIIAVILLCVALFLVGFGSLYMYVGFTNIKKLILGISLVCAGIICIVLSRNFFKKATPNISTEPISPALRKRKRIASLILCIIVISSFLIFFTLPIKSTTSPEIDVSDTSERAIIFAFDFDAPLNYFKVSGHLSDNSSIYLIDGSSTIGDFVEENIAPLAIKSFTAEDLEEGVLLKYSDCTGDYKMLLLAFVNCTGTITITSHLTPYTYYASR